MKIVHQKNSFSGGLVSPKLDARADQPKYASWLRQCQNMIPYRSGALTRAPGSQMIASAKLTNTAGHNYAVRLVPFIFSPATEFVLEFGHQYIRFYSNGVAVNVSSATNFASSTVYPAGSYVTDTSNSLIYFCILGYTSTATQPHADPTHWVQQTIYEVPSPYNGDALTGSIYSTDVFTIVPCQINDVVYIVSPNFPPYSLSSFGNTDWVLQEVEFLTPALLDQNATDTILTPSKLLGTGITVTASAPAWVAENYYTLANSVEVAGVIYDCVLANVSGSTFAADLALGYWHVSTIFTAGHIGSTWQLATLRNSAYTQWGADLGGAQSTAAGGFSAGTSQSIQCLGPYQVHTYGVWSATIQLQRSLDGGRTFDTVATWVGASDRNVDLSGTAAQIGIYQLVVSAVAVPINPGATAPRVVFECQDAFLYGLFEITGVTNSYVATANVITQLTDSKALPAQWVSGTSYTTGGPSLVSYGFVSYTCISNVSGSTPPPQDPTHWSPTQPGGTEYWREAAWSTYRGFPQAITSYQQRMIYASTTFEPQRVWGTVVNDIENFALGDQTLATDSIAFDINAPGRGPVQWMIAQVDLFIGFSGAEWVLNSGSTNGAGAPSGAAITPSNVGAYEQGTYGSAPSVAPTIVGNAVFFSQRQSDCLRQMLFSVYTEKYMSSDLTGLADQLFSSGIVQIAYQSRWHHQGIIWVVTKQGSLCGLTYDLDQEVFGWCKRLTGFGTVDSNGNSLPNDNGFESVTVIFGQGNNDDEVWVVGNRNVGGNSVRFIERIIPNNWEEYFVAAPVPPAPNLANAFYVDCGITATITGTSVGGLAYLNGRYVVGLATIPGSNTATPFGPVLVQGGAAQVPQLSQSGANVTVQVGLAIPYFGQPMRFDMDGAAGNLQARTKQVYEWYVRVWNSMGGSLSNGTAPPPTWQSTTAYTVGTTVISPLTALAYQCVVAITGGGDPSTNATNWVNMPLTSWQAAVPIPYTPSSSLPFATPALVTVPTDLKVPAMLQPSPGHDPKIIIQGADALPLTVLGIFLKMDVTSEP